jgi:cytochrome c-type biogenesis protein CcmE
MKPRQKRIIFAVIAVVGIGVASALVISALRSNIAYSFPPTKVLAGEVAVGQTFRLAGMVREDSLVKAADSLKSEFVVTDNEKDLRVVYTGILPDLFKEGQGTVAKGKLGPDGIFYAEEVLAKHDESYMPPEVADVMKPKGVSADDKPANY